ncbi:MAG TPA: DUF4292 domain-containing protein [Flavipsychrobacter sp.]|jgi:hypothetical protein|nr:DUF4292 domain-containing protein [Flavipsychrobacter sp.]
MSKRLFSTIIIASLIFTFSSCGIFKKGIRKTITVDSTNSIITPDSVRDTVAGGIVDSAKLQLMSTLSGVWQQPFDFATFTGKAKMHYEGKGQKQDFTTIFRIKKNETIWATVVALGGIMQVARVYITPDSLKLINYLDKEVTFMSLADASKVLPVPADFSSLQSLIIGTALRTTGTAIDAADLGNILSLQISEDNFLQQINYNKADTTINTLQMHTKDESGPSGVMQFSDYQEVNGKRFPMKRAVNVVNGGEMYYLDMDFNKAEFNQPVDFPFSIPKNYKLK